MLADRRAEVSELTAGLERIILRFGFTEDLDIPARLGGVPAASPTVATAQLVLAATRAF